MSAAMAQALAPERYTPEWAPNSWRPEVPSFALDLMPATAYWRAPLSVERKLDFGASEFEEAYTVEASRFRLGVIIAGAMEMYAAWVQRDDFGPAKLGKVPLFLADEMGAEMARLAARSYFEGASAFASDMGRQDLREGRAARLDRAPVWLTTRDQTGLLVTSARLGIRLAQSLVYLITPTLQAAFGLSGERRVSGPDLADQIRASIIKTWLEVPPPSAHHAQIMEFGGPMIEAFESARNVWSDEPLPRLGRVLEFRADPEAARLGVLRRSRARMKIRDRAAYENWQKSKLPYSKWIKQEVAALKAPVRLNPKQAAQWLVTQRTQWYAEATIASAMQDPEVATLTFSARRDGKTCEKCLSRDGITRPKDDPFWRENRPTIHDSCRCRLVPGTRAEKHKLTSLATIRAEVDPTDIQPGHGMTDATKVRSAKRLGIKGPKTAAQSKALRIARGIIRQRKTIERAARPKYRTGRG